MSRVLMGIRSAGLLVVTVFLVAGCGAGAPGPTEPGTPADGVGRVRAKPAANPHGKIVDGLYISRDEQLQVKTPGQVVAGMGGSFRYQQTPQGVRGVTFHPLPGAAPVYALTVVPTRLPRAARAAAGQPTTTREELRKVTLHVEARALEQMLGAAPEPVFTGTSEGKFGPVEHMVFTMDDAAEPGCRRLSGDPCRRDAVVSIHSFGTEDWTAVLTVTEYRKEVDQAAINRHRQGSVPHVAEMLDSVTVGGAVR